MPIELSPAVRRFQEIKARAKAEKIKLKEAVEKIKAVSPQLTDQQALQVYHAHLKQQQAQVIRIAQKQVKVYRA